MPQTGAFRAVSWRNLRRGDDLNGYWEERGDFAVKEKEGAVGLMQ